MTSKASKSASDQNDSTKVCPTHFSIGLDPKRWRGGLPALGWRRPDEPLGDADPRYTFTLEVPLGERDSVIGAYVAAWDDFEALKNRVVAVSMRMEVWQAEPVIALGLNVNALYDLVTGMCGNRLDDPLMGRLTHFLEGLKVRNTKRNRIIHGYWLCRILVANDTDGSFFISSSTWLRLYVPSSQVDRKKLSMGDKAAIGKYRFTIRELKAASDELISFCRDYADLPGQIGARLGAST